METKMCKKHNEVKVYRYNRYVCKSCKREYDTKWKNANPDRAKKSYSETEKRYRAKNLLWYLSLFDGKSCVDCGESRIPTLDFDHVDPSTKSFNISQARQSGPGARDAILQEIKKCVIRCANCHRLRSAEDFGWYALVDLVKDDQSSKVKKGSNHSRSKLTEDQVREIRRLKEAGVPTRNLMETYGISNQTVSSIVTRTTWKHV